MDVLEIRRDNLRKLGEEHRGFKKLSQMLGVSPSRLTQLAGPNPSRGVSEPVAREFEKTLNLPAGWMDADRRKKPEFDRKETPTGSGKNAEINRGVKFIVEVGRAVATRLEQRGLNPTPKQNADLIGLVYEDACEHGGVNEEYIDRLIDLIGQKVE